MTNENSARQRADQSFERKIRLAKWASVAEQLWVRLWSITIVAVVFALVTLSGAWAHLNDPLHVALLTAFGLASLASIIYIARIKWPARDEAVRRIERVSGVPHRPASSYEDTLTASASDPATRAIWQAHKSRLSNLMARLRSGPPKPRTDTHDPFAVRALLTLALVAGVALAGNSVFDRFGSAFHMSSFARLAEARLDAWVTPPAYTARPPLMLADGNNPLGSAKAASAATPSGQPLPVPDRSVVIVRASGIGSDALSLEVQSPNTAPEIIKPDTKDGAQDVAKDVQEVRYTLRHGATLRALAGTTEVGSWTLDVTPDQLPKISLTHKPELTPRGSLKLAYKVEDDYGVASAAAHVEKVKPRDADPAIGWSQPSPLKGPRPPLTRPPVLSLKVPHGSPKDADATSYLDLASHPWAGTRVMMNLEVTDVAGQVGRTTAVEMVLPERAFTKPLARAVIEQRRKLLDDPRYRDQVMIALDALTTDAGDFIKDPRVYLSLRTVYHRLGLDRSREGMNGIVEQLWQTALRIEDGDLSEAERALRDAQEKLSKALENGASEEEIKRLMEEMKQAFNDYMQQMAKQADKEDQANPDGDSDKEKFGKQDLDEMMKKFEDAAKNGSREDAEKMLSELRDVMERLKAGKSEDQAQQQQSKNLEKMMEKLVNMASEQQKLLDDTFKEQQQQGKDPVEQRGQRGGQKAQNTGKAGKSAQKGKGGPPGQGQEGQDGQGQNGPRGEDGEEGSDDGQGEQGQKGQGRGKSDLAERQRQLKDQIDELEKQMKDARAAGSKELNDAHNAMDSAEKDLNSSDLDSATENQGQALDKMRQSAKQMSEQMQKGNSRRAGEDNKKERDPLGRPQKTQGPDLGTSVKVPDQIDTQRAREVLEEVRRRLGEPTRPEGELDYLERLQKRF